MKNIFLAILGLFFTQSAFSADVSEMTQQQLLSQPKDSKLLILDVRTPQEFAQGHVPGAVNISHTEIENRLSEILKGKDEPVVVYCRSGVRAGKALDILKQQGFSDLHHLQGGMLGWEKAQLAIEK